MDKYKKSSKMTILVFSVTFLICGIWLGAWFVASQDMSIIRNLTAQPLADVFSSVNALFAGIWWRDYHDIFAIRRAERYPKRIAKHCTSQSENGPQGR